MKQHLHDGSSAVEGRHEKSDRVGLSDDFSKLRVAVVGDVLQDGYLDVAPGRPRSADADCDDPSTEVCARWGGHSRR